MNNEAAINETSLYGELSGKDTHHNTNEILVCPMCEKKTEKCQCHQVIISLEDSTSLNNETKSAGGDGTVTWREPIHLF